MCWPASCGDGCVGASLNSRCSGGAHAASSIAGAVGVAAVGACQGGVVAGFALQGRALLAGVVSGVVVCSAKPAAWFGGSAALPVMAEALALPALIRGAGRKVALGWRDL